MFVYSISFFFFFKQKTAYEMRISDWSSDVCSSDLTWDDCQRQWHRADLERRPRLVQGSRGGVALYRPGQAAEEWLRRELQRSDAGRAAQRAPVDRKRVVLGKRV